MNADQGLAWQCQTRVEPVTLRFTCSSQEGPFMVTLIGVFFWVDDLIFYTEITNSHRVNSAWSQSSYCTSCTCCSQNLGYSTINSPPIFPSQLLLCIRIIGYVIQYHILVSKASRIFLLLNLTSLVVHRVTSAAICSNMVRSNLLPNSVSIFRVGCRFWKWRRCTLSVNTIIFGVWPEVRTASRLIISIRSGSVLSP